MIKYTFTLISPSQNDWAEIESCVDATVFHTQSWDTYLSSLGKKSLVIAISNGEGSRVGFFIGTRSWLGIRIIGSPSGGSGTFAQGLCMKQEVESEERIFIYQELADFCFIHHYAGYIQITDWRLMGVQEDMDARMTWSMPALDRLGIHYSLRISFFIDMRPPESVLWERLKYKSCKYPIHKAEKLGLTVRRIESAEEIPSFIDIHSELVADVSRRKKVERHVHHDKKHLLALCKALFPDKVVMLQVIGTADDGEQHVMASSVFCVGKAASTYFSGASKEVYMKFCPNELMVWEAMKILRQKGSGDLILGDVAHYKKKFAPQYGYVPMMVFTKYPFLKDIRGRLKKLYLKLRKR